MEVEYEKKKIKKMGKGTINNNINIFNRYWLRSNYG